MKPEDVPDELRRLAREAFAGRPADAEGTLALPVDRNPWRALDDALAAVLPAHEAMVRAKVAAEIEAECVDPEWPNDDISRNGQHAARIARGEA